MNKSRLLLRRTSTYPRVSIIIKCIMVTTAVTAKPTTRVYFNTEVNNLFNEAGLLFNGNVLIRSNNVIVMFNNMRLKKKHNAAA